MLALRGAVSRFFSADGFFLAAGLAFFGMITLIPLLLLGVSILGFVLSTTEAANEAVGHLARNFPVYRGEIRAVLLRVIETRALSGLLGTVILILFSTPLFSASRLVLHRLLGVRQGGGFVKNLLVDAGTAIVLGLLLFGATIVTWSIDWFEALVAEPGAVPQQWLAGTNVAFSLGLSVALFYLAYRYVPHRRVRGLAAFAGAVLATLLWEVAKQLFGLYIRKVGLYDQIYGPLGVLIAFVMFAYYSAVVFVVGGAWVAALDARRR